jgi:large subunit ribosomal protein L18
VYRANRGLYAQLIDDDRGHTIAQVSWNEADVRKLDTSERAKRAGVETCVFDRGGYRFHGQVAALADGAREGGLKF